MRSFPLTARRTVAIFGVLATVAAAAAWSSSRAEAFVFRISVGAPQSHPLAPDFLGLGLEYSSVPPFVGPSPAKVNPVLVQLIRNLVPRGRPVLRIGGESSDRTWWPVPKVRRPRGITYNLGPRWIASARGLAQAIGGKLILGIGLEANRRNLDAVEAEQLLNGLSSRYIDALELGNEPELYTGIPWYRELRGKLLPWYSKLGAPVFARRAQYSPGAFAAEFSRTLPVLPQVPVAGPATGQTPWLTDFDQFLGRRSRIKLVTWHAYGLNECVTDPLSPQFPSVPNLLAPAASRDFLNGISPFVAAAHRQGAAFRVDEMGSVTCNGRLGVSNTFASALWAIDALFTADAAGVDGVNLHTFPNASNGLFDFTDTHGQWSATVHPLYYGALMFAQAAPPGSRLLQIVSPDQTNLRAWATVAPDHRTRVLLINDTLSSTAKVLVQAPATAGAAAVERLTDSGAYATSGMTLGTESFAPTTATGLLPPPRTAPVSARSGRYGVVVPASSAALLTLPAGP